MGKKLWFMMAFLCVCAMSVSAKAKAKKENQDVFPDGTPIPEWFLQSEVTPLDSLGTLYNIAKYGAVSSTEIVQTELIQSVIDKAAETGGVVYIPEGIYKSGSLFFKQGTHLYLTKGAVLLGSESIFDFPLRKTRIEGELCTYFPALINAENLDGFTVSGEGTVDGNGSDYWRAFRLRRQWNPNCTNKDEMRPRLMYMAYCKNVTVSGLAFQNSPFWTNHYYKCDHVKVLNLRIFSPIEPIKSASADGVDMDACTNFLIKGCRITVNDDAVCFKGGKGPYADQDTINGPCMNVLVEDCIFDHTTGTCMTCGSESIHVRNVLMRNCTVNGAAGLLHLKLRPDTPQLYEYITVENVKGFCNQMLNIAPWRQFFDLKGRPDIPKSYADHITLRNIELTCSRFVNASRNDEEFILSNFVLRDIQATTNATTWKQDAFNGIEIENVVYTPQAR